MTAAPINDLGGWKFGDFLARERTGWEILYMYICRFVEKFDGIRLWNSRENMVVGVFNFSVGIARMIPWNGFNGPGTYTSSVSTDFTDD